MLSGRRAYLPRIMVRDAHLQLRLSRLMLVASLGCEKMQPTLRCLLPPTQANQGLTTAFSCSATLIFPVPERARKVGSYMASAYTGGTLNVPELVAFSL